MMMYYKVGEKTGLPLILLSRYSYPEKEVVEVIDGSQTSLGVFSERFLKKISVDLIRTSLDLYGNQLPPQTLLGVTSMLDVADSAILGEVTYDECALFMKSSLKEKWMSLLYFGPFDSLMSVFDRPNESYNVAVSYNLANMMERSGGESARDDEFIRHGKLIISSLKSGDWLFHL